jgi:hypothetical protein
VSVDGNVFSMKGDMKDRTPTARVAAVTAPHECTTHGTVPMQQRGAGGEDGVAKPGEAAA